eukprot:m.27523 g.27523  ORF g.27523 m.27523 type:complete len:261 (+) comp9366_c0_seq1:55-837(+)
MESRALHAFQASQQDELTFGKGDVVKVINIDNDPNWFKAEMNGQTGYVPANYLDMLPHDWFHGTISRSDAESVLMSVSQNNAFLFRESQSSPGGFSLSVRVVNGKMGAHVQHFKILRDDNGKYFLWVTKFNSLNELINYHKSNSVSRGEEIFLLTPINRQGQPTVMQAVATTMSQADHLPAQPRAQPQPPQPQPQPPVPAQPQASSAKTVTAQYTFKPQEPGELPFTKGDVITVLDDSDANWWKGSLRGETGLFPASYVK